MSCVLAVSEELSDMMGYGGYGPGYGGMMSGGGWFIGAMMLGFGILFIALVVVLVLWAVRGSGGHSQSHHAAVPPVTPTSGASTSAAGHDEAVAIAKKRLASGEITPEQYAEIMRHLGG